MSKRRISTMSENGAPPQAAGALYPGQVMHARLKPFGHRFVYSVFSLLVDIDRLNEVGGMTWLLKVNRPGLTSFHESDHVEREGETLRAFADRLLADAGLSEPATRILLLAYPRILGYAVRNTFGQRHTYVAPIEAGDLGPAGVRQTRTKMFHVSPFIDMGTRYHFHILPPGKVVRLRIHETENGEPLLSATFAGKNQKLGTARLAACLLKFPFMTWKIVAGIHWEALKLWLKGARFRSSPPLPEPVSYRDRGAAFEPGE